MRCFHRAQAISQATTQVFIAGWWLVPELWLVRPAGTQDGTRLQDLLLAKAQEVCPNARGCCYCCLAFAADDGAAPVHAS